MQDLDPIQLCDKVVLKAYIEKLACMTKLYASQNKEMIDIDGTYTVLFLGLLLLSGYYLVSKEDYYCNAVENLKVDIVPTFMTRNHFRTIKKYFHLNDSFKLNLDEFRIFL